MNKEMFINDLKKQRAIIFRLLFFTAAITTIQILLPYLTKIMIDKEIPAGNFKAVMILLGWSLLLIFLSFILKREKIRTTTEISVAFQSGCRQRIFWRFQKLPYTGLKEVRFGIYNTNLIQDVENLSTYLFDKIAGTISDLAFFLFSFIVLTSVSPFLTFLLYLFIFLFTIFIYHLKKYMAQFYDDMIHCREEVNDTVHEMLSAQKIIAMNRISQHCLNKVRKYDHQLLIQTLKANIFGPMIQSSVEIATMITYIILFVFYQQSGISLGDLFLFLTYLPQVWVKYSAMMDIFNNIVASDVLIRRIYTECDNTDQEAEISIEISDAFADISKIDIIDAVFSFDPGRKLLNRFQSHLYSPGLYYLIGPSGIGKSTLFDLLMGFYHLESGQILYNNEELKEDNTKRIRKQIGLIPQEDYIFSGTLWENITLGREIDQSNIHLLAGKLGLDYYIEQLPNGLETNVSGADELPSGLKKTVSVLRACGDKPSLLLFDEVTSNLDKSTRQIIDKAVNILSIDHICIYITHKNNGLESGGEILLKRI